MITTRFALASCVLALCMPAVQAQNRKQVIPPEPASVSAIRKDVDRRIDALSARMFEISDWMYKNPEPGFLEFKASATLTDELKKHGFEIQMGVPGLPPDFDRLKLVGGLPFGYSGPQGIPTAFKA